MIGWQHNRQPKRIHVRKYWQRFYYRFFLLTKGPGHLFTEWSDVLPVDLVNSRSRLIRYKDDSWWRHQIEAFFALLAFCAGNSPVTGEFPEQRQVTRSFDVFFDPRLNKRLSNQSWGWWSETPMCPLWRHCNVYPTFEIWQIDWLVQERRNSSVLAMEVRPSCTKPSRWIIICAIETPDVAVR